MLERLSPTKRNVALGVLAVLLLWFFWSVRTVLNPLILGYLLAYIVHPMVRRLEARGWKRRSAVNVIFIGAGAVFTVLSIGIFLQGRDLARELAKSQVWDRLEERVESGLKKLEPFLPTNEDGTSAQDEAGADEPDGAIPAETEPPPPQAPEPSDVPIAELTMIDILADFWSRLTQEQAAGAGKVALQGAGGVWNLLQAWFGSLLALGTLFVLLPIYTYFLLFELGSIHAFVQRYVPVRERERVARIGGQVGEVLESFFRGRLLVCFVKGLLITGGLLLVSFDYALLLGMGSGFLSLVPFVGPFVGFVGATLVGLLNPEFSILSVFLRAALVFGIAEVLEGYVLVPKVLGDSLGLHPVVVLASVFVGGAALGMFGFLIALPLVAALIIVAREFIMPALAEWADEDEPAVVEPPG